MSSTNQGPSNPPQPPRQEKVGFLSTLIRNAPLVIFAYLASGWLKSNFLNAPQQAPKISAPSVQQETKVINDHLTIPIWPPGTPLEIYVSLKTSSNLYSNNQFDEKLPSKKFSDIRFGDWNWEKTWEFDFEVPESVKSNGTLWAQITLARAGAQIEYGKPGFDPQEVYVRQKLLTRFLPKRTAKKTKSLLTSNLEKNATNQTEPLEQEKVTEHVPVVSYYHPNLTIGIVSDYNVVPLKRVPPVVQTNIDLPPSRGKDPISGNFYRYPTVFPNDFWVLKDSLVLINQTTNSLPMRLSIHPMSYLKFQIFATMNAAFEQQASSTGGGAEIEEVKRMFTETAPWLLITTFIVSALHALFEFLAFSSDVTHWRNKKELVGVSIRTILSNIFVQVVVLLYLLDNSEGTSWIILFGQGTGVAIEAWKITKAVDIRIVGSGQGNVRYLPWLRITDKHVLSEDEKKTQEYDALAFRWVSYVAIPTLMGYTIYSLIYNEHKGWYSFTISTLSSFVYAFGFIELVPQLVINYKLKSVAHMPLKAMMYKTLNTIVDDFFAFCIKMPLLHRLACFRDDVVFVILLYQYWIYKVDYNRINEFGQPGNSNEKSLEKTVERSSNETVDLNESEKNK
ncbi:cleft lip and palate transmembrane protein 1-domain-containing protein [Phakopsora pachyrhizi]|uniref:Cleft lip and palate transmembrane protein 1-domain-containing protein n=1 Tax=Phakopsora pachyrhizi TaxID=170000 RepID=A0AAV0BV68_PHAPC|nr:cleft lip and palate transmembrane protein 1-domain-containing protein [Phakopsora pachyrhizi]CAH7690356.1 cleft lip and palate transmembrane protein 1-domain-containing protein [Phakopsora pachyrhizi]